jgi:hypothetical protein
LRIDYDQIPEGFGADARNAAFARRRRGSPAATGLPVIVPLSRDAGKLEITTK